MWSAAAANRPANRASASGRLSDLRPLSSVSVPNATATIVSVANGKSRQRGSNTKPSAVSAAMTVVTVNVKPRIMVDGDRGFSLDGQNNSRNVGSARPDINARDDSSGAAIAATKSTLCSNQSTNP